MAKKKNMIDAEKLIHELVYAAHGMIDAGNLSAYDYSDSVSVGSLADSYVRGLSLNETVEIIEKMEEK